MGFIADGPDAVAMFRLITLRGAVKLEAIGLKSRAGSMRKRAALECGLKPGAKHGDVIAALTERIEAMHAAGVGFTRI